MALITAREDKSVVAAGTYSVTDYCTPEQMADCTRLWVSRMQNVAGRLISVLLQVDTSSWSTDKTFSQSKPSSVFVYAVLCKSSVMSLRSQNAAAVQLIPSWHVANWPRYSSVLTDWQSCNDCQYANVSMQFKRTHVNAYSAQWTVSFSHIGPSETPFVLWTIRGHDQQCYSKDDDWVWRWYSVSSPLSRTLFPSSWERLSLQQLSNIVLYRTSFINIHCNCILTLLTAFDYFCTARQTWLVAGQAVSC